MKKLQSLISRPLFAGILLLAPFAMVEARGDRPTHSGGGHEEHRGNGDHHDGDDRGRDHDNGYERGYEHGYDHGYNHGYDNNWGGVGIGIDVVPGGGVYTQPVYQEPVYVPEPGVNIQIGN